MVQTVQTQDYVQGTKNRNPIVPNEAPFWEMKFDIAEEYAKCYMFIYR